MCALVHVVGGAIGITLPLMCLTQGGNTALYRASICGHNAVVDFLLDHGAEVDKVQYSNIISMQCSTTSQASM